MASNLRVDTILPSTGTSLGIGTASGTTTVTGTLNAASATITGNLGVGGVLTYEDVTNVDSVGLITARSGVNVSGGEVKVGTAVTVSSGGVITSGVVTATSYDSTVFSKIPTNTPAFHAFREGSISPTLSDATATKVTILTNETLDTDSAYDGSKFTIPAGKGGFYQVAAGLNFYADSNDMKQARVMIYKNGSVAMTAYGFVSSYTAGQRHLQCDIAGVMNLNASDYLEVYAYLDTNGGSGGYISNDANGLRGNYFSAFKLII